MSRNRGFRSAILGLVLGMILGVFMLNYRTTSMSSVTPQSPTKRSSVKVSSSSAFVQNVNFDSPSKNLVFVGVMTAQKYLTTRAKAVYETWGKEVPGTIAFFSSESSRVPENCPNLPLVALPTVDDSYPPQKKSFLMLQYMWKNFGDKFEWFFRADDDVYVRTDRLEKLLRSVDPRKAMYIGQAGKGIAQESGLLSLDHDENFCMGGPGVIMSRETLKKIIPHVKDCLKNLYTTHEDVELGRCVRKYAGIPCTWSYEMQSIFYHNHSGDQAFTGNLKKREVHGAITLHPVKSPPHMYRLHNYMRGLKIQDLQQRRIKLHRDIAVMAEQLEKNIKDFVNHPLAHDIHLFPGQSDAPEDNLRNAEVLGVPAGLKSFKPQSTEEVVPWSFISKSEYSLTDWNCRRRIHSDVKEGLDDIVREVMASINSYSRQRGRVVEGRSTLYGYRRVNAYGADTILDLLLVYRKYRGRKVTLPVRWHVYVHQHFIGMEMREIVNDEEVDPYHQLYFESQQLQTILPDGFLANAMNQFHPVEDKVIQFILPLSGRFQAFERFLKNYEQVCLIPEDKTELYIVIYPHKTENSINSTMNLIQKLKSKYSNSKIETILASGNFSRARALDLGAFRSNEDDLLFFIDVDIAFTTSALQRVRLNTIYGKKVYFPIVFSQYDPKFVDGRSNNQPLNDINEVAGYWRQFGFGIVSLYKKDYLTIGGFNAEYNGWGKEDVDFFEKAIKSKIEVFRAPDQGFIHVYHKIECDESLPAAKMAMCTGTRFETLASVHTLSQIIYEHSEYLRLAHVRKEKLAASGG